MRIYKKRKNERRSIGAKKLFKKKQKQIRIIQLVLMKLRSRSMAIQPNRREKRVISRGKKSGKKIK